MWAPDTTQLPSSPPPPPQLAKEPEKGGGETLNQGDRAAPAPFLPSPLSPCTASDPLVSLQPRLTAYEGKLASGMKPFAQAQLVLCFAPANVASGAERFRLRY